MMSDESYEIKCPHCGSPKWTCWDEQTEDFEGTTTGEIYEWPVGYMRCNECDRTYLDTGIHEQGVKHLGRWDDDLEGYR
jgi:hypothetical protein